MTKTNIYFRAIGDDVFSEPFPVLRTSLGYSLNKSVAIKSATASLIYTKEFKNFLLLLNEEKILLCDLYVDDKLYLQGFINDRLIHYADGENGTDINIRILDRFVGLISSDTILSRPNGTLQSYLSNVLTELGYDNPRIINTYNRKIKTTKDFLKASGDINLNEPLKALRRSTLTEEDTSSVLGECLGINQVMLISNGYDTLTFEKPNILGDSTFSAFRYLSGNKSSNIISLEKYGEMGDANSLMPSIIITLNTYKKATKKDNNTSNIAINKYGIPHVVRINRVNSELSYQDIDGMMNFAFAGIKARSNSFIIRLANSNFDKFGNFFQPNRTIRLYDEKYGLDFNMVIMEVKIDIDSEGGSETTLNVSFTESFIDNVSIKQKGRILR